MPPKRMLTALKAKKGPDSSKSHTFEERMCYHTHSSPNESIDFAVLWRTQSIDSFGKNGDIFSICTIYIFQTFFGTFPMTFL